MGGRLEEISRSNQDRVDLGLADENFVTQVRRLTTSHITNDKFESKTISYRIPYFKPDYLNGKSHIT